MFKANRVSIPKEGISNEHNPQIVVSSIFKDSFHKLISELGEKHLKQQTAIKDATLQKAFHFFDEQKITFADLVAEIKSRSIFGSKFKICIVEQCENLKYREYQRKGIQ